jgi:serralysin
MRFATALSDGSESLTVSKTSTTTVETVEPVATVETTTSSDSLLVQGDSGQLVSTPQQPDFTFYGTSGTDYLYGTSGSDLMFGYAGTDYLYGFDGDDIIFGGSGADVMVGGRGNDTYYVDTVGEVIWEWGGLAEGNDTVRAIIDYQLPSGVERLELIGSACNGTGNELNNDIVGNAGSNVLSGLAGYDNLYGGAGNDYLYGGADYDSLYGGADNDNLYGGEGGDALDGGTGADVMVGGLGSDTYYVDNAGDVVWEWGGEGTSDMVIAHIDYTLPTGVEVLALRGAAVQGTGNELDNGLIGSDLDNLLSGLAGNDNLYGGRGNDVLVGGMGQDILRGVEDADRFVWNFAEETGVTLATMDVIADFNFAQGDRIDLSGIDADVYAAGNQGFHFIGQGAFTGTPGEINYYHSGGNTIIQLQTGTGTDIEGGIVLQGLHNPDASWFAL